jgi:hypothetical protein
VARSFAVAHGGLRGVSGGGLTTTTMKTMKTMNSHLAIKSYCNFGGFG